jgi:hypothetical protein
MRTTTPPRAATLLALALLPCAAACAGSPPPMAMPIDGVLREPVDSTTLRLYGTYAGDVGSPAAAAGGQIVHQFARDLALGAVGTWGGTIGQGASTTNVGEGRVYAKINPGTDTVAFSFGVGAGAVIYPAPQIFLLDGSAGSGAGASCACNASAPQPFVTGDAGARGEILRVRSFEVYAGETAAISVSTLSQPAIVYFLTDLGVLWRSPSRVSVGVNGTMLWAVSDAGGTPYPLFFPTLSLGYTFGDDGDYPPRKPNHDW